MSMDRDLVCRSCGQSFTFTSGEQTFYARMGFSSAPSRCPECRAADRSERGVSDTSGSADVREESLQAELFASRCTQCGKEIRVSALLALGDEPTYCPECLAESRRGQPASDGGWRENW